MGKLDGKKVAALFTDGVEQVELDKPVEGLKGEGADVEYVTLEAGEVQAFNHLDHGDKIQVDKAVKDADASDYDALLLPGGVANPDFLRMRRGRRELRALVRRAGQADRRDLPRPLDARRGRRAEGPHASPRGRRSRPTSATRAATGSTRRSTWTRASSSSRNPDDLPAFTDKIIEEFCEGKHEEMAASAQGASS